MVAFRERYIEGQALKLQTHVKKRGYEMDQLEALELVIEHEDQAFAALEAGEDLPPIIIIRGPKDQKV